MFFTSIIYSLFYFIYFLIILQFTTCYAHINKCCPNGMVLDIRSNTDGQTYYDCIPNDNETLYGYNLRSVTVAEIPECENLEVQQFTNDTDLISTNGCIDSIGSTINNLKCPNQEKINVHRMYKCCPDGYSYDSSERFCIKNANFLHNFNRLFGDSVVLFNTKIPKCAADEVFVEYHSKIHDIWLNHNTIAITSVYRNTDVLAQGTFCIDGLVNNNPNKDENVIVNEDLIHIIVRSCRPKSICEHIPCVRRCCENDQMMARDPITGKAICLQHPDDKNIKPIFHEVNLPIDTNIQNSVDVQDYGILHNQNCKKYRLEKDQPSESHFISHLDGKLYVNETREAYDVDSYCIEFTKTDSIELHTFLCFRPNLKESKFFYYPLGLTISCIFLGITLIVYLCLPKLLNLHGKTLVCYVISLLAAFICLSVVQFNTETQLEHCYEAAFLMFFCFMAAFCWQSVMCFDIWLTFGSIRSSFVMRHNKDQRRFIYYSVYAWLIPLLWTILTIFIDRHNLLSDKWSPSMGGNTCWFTPNHWRGHLLFFVLPIGLHILVNSVLFILTSIHCSRVKNEIRRMQSASDADAQTKRKTFIANKAIFTMNVKLFVVMGVSWIIEIITTLTELNGFWRILDIFNILQGVLVFFIFVFKRKVLYAFQQKLGIKRRKNGTSTPRSTTTTNTVNISLKDKITTGQQPLGKQTNDSTLLALASNVK